MKFYLPILFFFFLLGCANQEVQTSTQGVVAIDLGDRVSTLEIGEDNDGQVSVICENLEAKKNDSLHLVIHKQNSNFENEISRFELTSRDRQSTIVVNVSGQNFKSSTLNDCIVQVQSTQESPSFETVEISAECMLVGKENNAFLSMADLVIEGCE